MVSFYKHAYYGSSCPLDPKSIAHVCGHVCKMKKWHACSQGNIFCTLHPRFPGGTGVTRQYYIKKQTCLEKSDKACAMYFVVFTLHIALI